MTQLNNPQTSFHKKGSRLTGLLNVDKAISMILAQIPAGATETIDILQAPGRVLAEDIISTLDLPPFASSAMDGYAVQVADTVGATPGSPVTLNVVMDIPAGVTPARPLEASEAARIMTGAPVPDGADGIIPVEDTDGDWSKAIITPLADHVALYRPVEAGEAIRQAGENIRTGETILKKGTVLGAAEIGMLAAIGQRMIPVIQQPRVVILSTGDELVGIDDPLTPGKIRDVNSYTLAVLVQQNGGQAIRLPVASDELDAVRALFNQALAEKPDMIVSSAGVSAGATDLIRKVLEERGAISFWKINLRPGKPLAFGNLEGVPFFGLPGNPVSAMVTFDVLVRPALLRLGGQSDVARYEHAIAGEPITSDGRRSYIRVRLTREDDDLIAHTTGTQSSGALMSMVMADGLLIIPEDIKRIETGTKLRVKLLRHIP